MAIVAALLLASCSEVSGPEGSAGRDATVTRTTYGIPHVRAKNWGGLGYGYGYAFAEDNLCTMMEDFVTIRGERAKWFGREGSYDIPAAGAVARNVDSDFFWKLTADAARVEALAAASAPEMRELGAGWVDGFNRYLRELRGGEHPGRHAACAGAPWLSEISTDDLFRRFVRLAVIASSTVLENEIATAQPPGASAAAATADEPASTEAPGSGDPLARLRDRRFGSNMYALGPDATRGGQPIVFGNPHFPWYGTERLYVVHLQIPGTIDIEGASLYGVPLVLIGFNDHVAWSHTVSTAYRFGLFQLSLVPGRPTQYLVDGEVRDMEAVPLEIEVREGDGRTTTERRTLWRSEYGPMVTISVGGTPVLAWTDANAFALRDANLENTRMIEQFFHWNTARNLDEFKQLHASILGTPWVNTVASGPDGDAYYGDVTVVPNVSDAKAKECTPPIGAVVAAVVPGLPVLDGSRSACRWDDDPDAPAPGIFGPGHLPTLERRDWVANMNDSHWLTNPKQPVEGYARVIGDERTERSLRTRLGILQVQRRLDGTDGRPGKGFDLDVLKDVVLSADVHSGELARGAVLSTTCSGEDDAGVSEACDALSRWDGTASLDAIGYPLWLEFWRRLPTIPWRTAFDLRDPVNTPRDFDASAPGVAAAFAGGAAAVRDAGFALDAPLREVQHSGVNDPTIPIFGGPGGLGAFTVTYANGFGAGGYRVVDGNSYIQAVTWEDGRVHAEGFLTYSQSTDPANPHYADFTRAYSEKRWHRFPFTAEEIAASKESETRLGGR